MITPSRSSPSSSLHPDADEPLPSVGAIRRLRSAASQLVMQPSSPCLHARAKPSRNAPHRLNPPHAIFFSVVVPSPPWPPALWPGHYGVPLALPKLVLGLPGSRGAYHCFHCLLRAANVLERCPAAGPHHHRRCRRGRDPSATSPLQLSTPVCSR